MEVCAMKSTLSIVFALAFAVSASAQDNGHAGAPRANSVPPVQAPPAMDDTTTATPVALPTPQAQAQSAVVDSQSASPDKLAESPPLPAEVQAAANAAELPVITVRQQGADTVEEYRKKGKLYFVRVLSSSGPAKYYVNDPAQVPPSMREITGPSGVVQPVYYKLLEWK
jgi:hypothetical protein